MDKNGKVAATYGCRDSFQDIFHALKTNAKSGYYHSYTINLMPNNYQFRVSLPIPNFNVNNASSLINVFSEKLGFTPVKISISNAFVLFDFDDSWTQKPLHLNLLTYLMRLTPSYTGGDLDAFFLSIETGTAPSIQNSYDVINMKRIRPILQHILSGKPWVVPKDWKDYSVGNSHTENNIHSSSGIASYGPVTIGMPFQQIRF